MRTMLVCSVAAMLVFTGCAATSNSGGNSGAAALKSIQVKATSASVAAGLTVQLTATGIYGDGSSKDVTNAVSWSSSNSNLAAISASGLLTGKAQGSVTVTASSGSATGNTNISVTAALIASLSGISPPNARIAANTLQQFRATAKMSDGTSADVTNLVNWKIVGSGAQISNTVPTKGLVTAGSPTSTTTLTVTATCGTGCPAQSGQTSVSASLTVTNALATSIAITPISQTIGWGNQQQFTAIGTFDDGSTQDITPACHWQSADTTVVFITSSSGLAVGKSIGTTTVQAAFETVQSNAASLTVDLSNLTSVSVSPSSAMIAAGTQFQFTAIGTFTDGSTRNLGATKAVVWTSANTSVATISTAGVAQGVGQGTTATTSISASVSVGGTTLSGSGNLDVENATLDSIAVAPANASIPVNAQINFAALGTFTGSNCSCQFQEGLTGQSTTTWTSTSSAAKIIGAGIVKGQAAGNAVISASSSLAPGNVQSNGASLTVTPVTLVAINVLPANTFIPPGATVLYSAIGVYSDNSTQNLTQQVTWSASPGAVATIASWGLATAQGQGSATVTATCSNSTSCNPGGNSVVGSTSLLVTSSSLVSIAIAPANPRIAENTAAQLTAMGTFADGSKQDLTGSVNWSSSTHTVATIGGQTGILNANAPGQTTVTATFGSITGTTTVTVTNATLQSISVSPNSATVNLGGSVLFNAVGHFSDGSTQNLLNENWSSSNSNVAIVTNFGLATSSGSTGTATISAKLNGVTGTAVLTVQ